MPIVKRIEEKILLKTFTDAEKTIGITPNPVIDFPDQVGENTTTQGIITNMEANETYIISANYGTILYSSGNTFEYSIGDVNGMFDLADVISVRGIIYNRMPSSVVGKSIIVINSIPETPTPHFDITSPVFRNSITNVIIDTHDLSIESYTISATLGNISNVANGTFDYTAPNNTSGGSLFDIVTITAQGIDMTESQEYSVTVEVLNISEVTITPIVEFTNIMLEETTVQGIITNHVEGITYTITPTTGVITNLVDDIFDYTAPAIIADQNESFSIIAHKITADNSTPLIVQFQITNRVTPYPTISLGSEVDEGTTINGAITNYVAGTTYTFSANYGSAEDNLDGTFTYTPNPVIIDTNESILTTATMSGDYPSTPVESNIIIRNIAQNTPTPTLNFAGGYRAENSSFSITITNYDSAYSYAISANHGTITNISGATFNYNTPEISGTALNDILILRATAPGDIQSGISILVIINNSISIKPTVAAFPSSMNSDQSHTATITNHTSGTTYGITALHGTISNKSGSHFTYTAPTTSVDLVDTLYLYAYNPTDKVSSALVLSVNVLRSYDYQGWPCEFSHHSNKHHCNLLKTCTTSPSTFLQGINNSTSLNKSIYGTSLVITSSRIYLLGFWGIVQHLNEIRYSSFNGSTFSRSFTTAPIRLATAVCNAATIMIKNKVYVIGGAGNSPTYKGVQVATINSSGHIGNFSTAGNLPIGLINGRAVITKNRVYIIGGLSGTTMVPAVYYATINSSGNLGSWIQTYSLPSPQGYGNAFLTKNRIYYISNSAAYYTTINSDGSINSWSVSGGGVDTGYCICTYDRVFIIKLVQGYITVHSAYITNGVVGSWSPYWRPVADSYWAGYGVLFVASSKVYMIGSMGKVLVMNGFDGWDPRQNDSSI